MNKEEQKANIKKFPAMSEFSKAFEEYFKGNKKPKNDKEEKKQMEEFTNWYNNERKQDDTGKTPAEMYREVYRKEPPKNSLDSNEPSRIMNFEWDEDYRELDEMFCEADKLCIQGKYKEASKLVERILEIIPNDEEALLLKSQILTNLNDLKEAEKLLEYSAKINGKTAHWHFYFANFLFFKGNFAGAFKNVKSAIESEPENFDFIMSYSQYLCWNNDERYKYYLDLAKKIDKKRADNFYKTIWMSREELFRGEYVGVLLLEINNLLAENPDKAIENIYFVIKNKEFFPEKIIDMLLGLEIEALFVKKDITLASQKIEELIRRNKNNPHAYYYKAQLLLHEKKFGEALNLIDKCLEIAETGKMPIPHPDFYLLKADILKELDDDSCIYYENKGKQLRDQTDILMRGMEDLMGGKK